MIRLCIVMILLPCLPTRTLRAQEQAAIPSVVLHPIVNDTFACAEHAEGELNRLGDALGKDCMVIRMDSTRAPGRRLPSLYEGDGLENEGWFGWGVPLLAPCDGAVESTAENLTSNRPGELPGKDVQPASEIVFACASEVHVIYAHVRSFGVQPGDSVAAGDPVAEIGNNAVSRAPHVHVGAWEGDTPLQIRFDLRVLGELRRAD